MPGYQPGPAGWPSGPPGPSYSPPRRRRSGMEMVTAAPALSASLAISVGVGLLFLANLFVALGAQNGTPGRDRLLQFLSPADLAVGAVMALAVALTAWHRLERSNLPDPVDPVATPGGPAQSRGVALAAGTVAAVVALGALLRGIVVLTIPHQHGAIKVGNLIDALAAALVAAMAAAWGLRSKR